MKENFLIKNPLFKIIACATMLGMVASCSDYLDKYQDEAIIAAENTDDEISSSSESDVFSSASVESNGSIAFSSSVAVSSGSVDAGGSISSSSPNNTSIASSSSVAVSSSSVECTGTVLFSKEAKDKKAIYAPNEISPIYNLTLAQTGTYFYSYLNSSDTSNGYYDVTPWQGLCIEYSSTRSFTVSLMRVSDQDHQKYAIEAEFMLDQTNESVTTRQMYWNELKRKKPVYEAILTAVNMLKVETYDSGGKATINKITAITSDNISKTNTFTVKNDMQNQEWFISAKNKVTFDDASTQCTEGNLPTLNDIKNLGLILEGSAINSGSTAEYIYPILVGDLSLSNQTFALDGNPNGNSYALWTSEGEIVYFTKDDSSGKKIINWQEPTKPLMTTAKVHCIKKDN